MGGKTGDEPFQQNSEPTTTIALNPEFCENILNKIQSAVVNAFMGTREKPMILHFFEIGGRVDRKNSDQMRNTKKCGRYLKNLRGKKAIHIPPKRIMTKWRGGA